ncbi:MAG TPA: CorA family divalent cation transporter, partial [Chitinophagaceae bacterium]
PGAQFLRISGMAVQTLFSCQQFRWIDAVNPAVAEMERLASDFQLNAFLLRDSLDPGHLPKYERSGDRHFLILRYYAHSFDRKMGSIQELTDKIVLFYSDDFLLTLHKAEVGFLKVLQKNLEQAKNCGSVTELLTKIVWQVLASFSDPAARLDEQVDFYEARVMVKKSTSDLMEALYYIKRQATLVHKVLLLTLEPIHHIYIREGEEAFLQDVKDEHLKMQTLYSGMIDEVNNLLNLSLSFAAQRTNDVMRVLTIFSVFFMPLTFVVGIYGMNFHYMPELDEHWGYPAVLGLMALMTVLTYLYFKTKKWL